MSKYWYNKSIGRKKKDGLLMLKIHLLQKYYHLRDEAVEDEIWNQIAFQKFLNIDVGTQGVPDSTFFPHIISKKQKIF